MELFQTGNSNYSEPVLQLYIDAFSRGASAQYIDTSSAAHYVDDFLIAKGVILAVEKDEITGALLFCPFENDPSIPQELKANFDIKKCLYVAEMMVQPEYRGKGIGAGLLDYFIEKADVDAFTDVFIRVWEENLPALNLYLKKGFQPVASITQVKRNAANTADFIMKKIYLHRSIS